MNNVSLTGRLCADPELRTTNSGKDVCSFTIAVRKVIKAQDGTDADFIRCKAWGQSATYMNDYMTKGRLVGVEGRLETSKWTDQQGNKRETLEVVCNRVEALDRARDDDNGGGSSHRPQSDPSHTRPAYPAPAADEYDPFADE
jgi:single-strand DNA-binding protein